MVQNAFFQMFGFLFKDRFQENTVLRANLKPQDVFVIPNAIDPNEFSPLMNGQKDGRLRIVVMSRLVYRKGLVFFMIAFK